MEDCTDVETAQSKSDKLKKIEMKLNSDNVIDANGIGAEASKDCLIELPMEIDSSYVMSAEASKDCLIEMPMELDLSTVIETRKSHMITCPVCFEISILSKQSNLYENIISACIKGNSKI